MAVCCEGPRQFMRSDRKGPPKTAPAPTQIEGLNRKTVQSNEESQSSLLSLPESTAQFRIQSLRTSRSFRHP